MSPISCQIGSHKMTSKATKPPAATKTPREKPFVCPECGTKIAVNMGPYWLCEARHRTPKDAPVSPPKAKETRLPYAE